MRIYTPGQPQLWQPNETVPALPDNLFREWKRVTDPIGGTGEHSQAWTIRDWQHQGYQRILSHLESFSTHHARDQSLVDMQNSDAIRVEEMFTYAPLFLTVIARLLCNSLQSSMATPVMLIVVIFRSRLLSGLGQFRVPLAAVDILANDRDIEHVIFLQKKETSRPSLRGVCVRSDRIPCHHYFLHRGTIHLLCAMVQRSGHSKCGYRG